MLVITYITHNYYILIYYIITQLGRSPLKLARIWNKHEVVKILKEKLRK